MGSPFCLWTVTFCWPSILCQVLAYCWFGYVKVCWTKAPAAGTYITRWRWVSRLVLSWSCRWLTISISGEQYNCSSLSMNRRSSMSKCNWSLITCPPQSWCWKKIAYSTVISKRIAFLGSHCQSLERQGVPRTWTRSGIWLCKNDACTSWKQWEFPKWLRRWKILNLTTQFKLLSLEGVSSLLVRFCWLLKMSQLCLTSNYRTVLTQQIIGRWYWRRPRSTSMGRTSWLLWSETWRTRSDFSSTSSNRRNNRWGLWLFRKT